jgi:hypothetical protein
MILPSKTYNATMMRAAGICIMNRHLYYGSIDWQSDHTFNFEDIGDAISLSDDSLWLITGRLLNNAAIDGEYEVSIINNLDHTVSYTGKFSEQILYVHGAGLVFYVNQVN